MLAISDGIIDRYLVEETKLQAISLLDFFFQAEDGIRDWSVTGVQTCALPISLRDYLAGLKQDGQWDGNAPPPPLPREVVEATSERYLEAYRRITGKVLETAR